MDRKKSGLSRKMTVLCLMLAVVICAGACTVGYFTYRNSIYEAYSSFAYGLAYTASSYVDGDRITGYLDTGTPDEAYDEMARHLNTIYQSTELSSIYISKPKPETMTLLNIYDVRIHEAADPAPYAIGVEDPITGDPEEVVRIYETGELSDSYFIRKSRFGYNTSAILPVQNSAGETVAILVADMPMPNIIRDLNRYLALTMAVTVLLGLPAQKDDRPHPFAHRQRRGLCQQPYRLFRGGAEHPHRRRGGDAGPGAVPDGAGHHRLH